MHRKSISELHGFSSSTPSASFRIPFSGLGDGGERGLEYARTSLIAAMDDEGVASMKPASTVRARLWIGVELSNGLGQLGCLLQHFGKHGPSIISRQTTETTDYVAFGYFNSWWRGYEDLCWFTKSPALLLLPLFVCGAFDIACFLQRPLETFVQRPIAGSRGNMLKTTEIVLRGGGLDSNVCSLHVDVIEE
jgi:hypothetical protein